MCKDEILLGEKHVKIESILIFVDVFGRKEGISFPLVELKNERKEYKRNAILPLYILLVKM